MVEIVRHQPSSALSSLVSRRKMLCDGRHGFKSNALAVDFPELHSQKAGAIGPGATPDILELPEVAPGLEQQLIHVMVRCLGYALDVGCSWANAARRYRKYSAQFSYRVPIRQRLSVQARTLL